VLVVAATSFELDLIEGAETLCCGIGPVEAALQTSRAIATQRPTAILHIGIAGAHDLGPPTIVLGSASVYCDLVDPAFTLPRVERVEPDTGLLALAAAALPGAHVLPIATTARVGGGACCRVEAMEGFGVLRAAALAGVPAVELRAISNLVDDDRSQWRIAAALEALAAAASNVIEAFHG